MRKKWTHVASALVIAGSIYTYSGTAALAANDDITGIALEQPMRSLINQGIIQGFGPGQFHPSEKVTRGQFAAFISRALQLPPGTPKFKDVPASSGLADAINRVSNAGIVNGYDDGTFRMHEPITREQMAAMIDNALVFSNAERKESMLTFADSYQINNAFRQAVGRVVNDKIVSGYKNSLGISMFKPKNEATRAEAAAFISGMLSVIKELQAQGTDGGGAVPAPAPVPAPQPAPAPAVVDHSLHHGIMGTPVVTAAKMAAFVKRENPNAPDIDEIATAFIEIGNKYGIRGDIAFCQSIVETGWFKYNSGTAVTPDQHNYGGLGVTQKGIKGNIFPTVQEGVTAQIQHLYGYASQSPIPAGETIVDQRFEILERYGKRGTAPHWQDLSGVWAGDRDYGNKILAIYHQLQNS
ncbi:S-layer homology domain-containing protein [Bacillus benzoevorans]|uniref:Uncharacterized protein YwgA n=1 Tax=Bacillus benzoevorans TaxID=1456 RepID=A0A7X0HSH6_9BACI|nr:S-layer homology domain-containing protein [Bacillus benzoevorans]MBB6446034.1 uncharacterized protein YwgA [Bacillus benzoevorans]